jgi:hypothetical protein
MFDSPQHRARTIVTCSKRTLAPRDFAPRRRRPQNKEAVLRRLCFCEAARPNAVSRGTGKQERAYPTGLCFPRTEAASAAIEVPLYSAVSRGGGVGSGCRRQSAASRRRGANVFCRKDFASVAPLSRGLQTERRGDCRDRSIGHVRYCVSRRVR